MKNEKTRKNPEKPEKTRKSPKKPEKTHWVGFFQKNPGFFQPWLEHHQAAVHGLKQEELTL